ncbi:Bor/Iss family lipoprotein [Haliangium sp.]|uniref:Bor/Iss family lipoprotein n=1 Tax=Haliangium sp. TaxID=2663208 RepID=UPI003D10C145
MKRATWLGLALALALALGAVSCERVQYRSTLPPSGQMIIQWNDFFLWGLLGTAWIRPNMMCPQGVHGLDVYHSPANVLITLITLGLYSPTTVEIYCATGDGYGDDYGASAPASAPASAGGAR